MTLPAPDATTCPCGRTFAAADPDLAAGALTLHQRFDCPLSWPNPYEQAYGGLNAEKAAALVEHRVD